MIQPIYFPFTYVPQWVAEVLTAGFGHFHVYQPSGKELPAEMQPWAENNVMHICVPVPSEEKKFTEVVSAFEQFAHLHADAGNLKAFWNQPGAIPFFDETSASQIVADLKTDQQPNNGLAHPEALLKARVFLEFAQEFDRQNVELQQELEETDRCSEDLLKNLSGKKNGEPAPPRLTAEIKFHEPGDYMPLDRLQAWIHLFLEKPINTGFLVTSSPTIFNSLVEELMSENKIFEFNGLPALASGDQALMDWREALCQQIKNGLESGEPFTENALVSWPPLPQQAAQFKLSVCRWPECTPAQLFARFIKSPIADINKFNQTPGIKNTILGLIERCP